MTRRSRMALIALLAAALALAVPLATVAGAAPVELVPNGGYEVLTADPTTPANWRHDYWDDITASFSVPGTGAHGGQRSARIDVTSRVSGAAKYSFDPQPVTPGQSYVHSTWYRSDVTTELLAVYTTTSGTTQYQWLSDPPPASTWTQVSTTFVVPQGVTTLTVFHSIAAVGFLQTDDVSVTTVPPPTSLGIVPNGDLEVADAASGNPVSWYPARWGTNTATFTYPTGGAHGGTRYVHIDMTQYTDGGATWTFASQPATPNRWYEFSSWYRANQSVEMLAVMTLTDGSTAYQLLGHAAPASSWTQFKMKFLTPSNLSTIHVFQSAVAVGSVDVDDVSLVLADPTPFNRSVVSLTFDDAYASHISVALPKLVSTGLKGTFFLTSGDLSTSPDPDYMMRSQVSQLSQNGMEVGSHTVTHPFLTQVSDAQLTAELANSKTDLQGLSGQAVTNFASPYGDYNQVVVNKVMLYYGTHRTSDDGYNTRDSLDFYRIKVKTLLSTTTTAEIQGWIDQANTYKLWLVLVFHDIRTTPPSQYDMTPTQFDAAIDAVKASGVTVETVEQARAELAPQLG